MLKRKWMRDHEGKRIFAINSGAIFEKIKEFIRDHPEDGPFSPN